MKRLAYLSVILVFILAAVFGCASAGSAGISSTEESYNASGLSVRNPERAASFSEARGKIVIYTSMYEGVFNAIEEAMVRYFPELDVIFVYGGTGQVQARIEAEIKTGNLGCDILMVAEPSYSIELKEKGLLHPFTSKEAVNLAFEYDPQGYWYPVRVSNMVFAYNPEKNSKNDVPQMYYEFAYSPDARGLVSMGDPFTSGTTLVTINALWDRYSVRYFEALGRQNVSIDTYTASLEKLEKGQIKTAMVLEETVLRKNQTEGSKLEIIYPSDGSVVIPSTIVIINDQWNMNSNTSSAEAITEWFLSEEGQSAIVSGWMHSVRRNFARYPAGSVPTSQITANAYPVVWENVYRNRDEIRRNFQQHVRRR